MNPIHATKTTLDTIKAETESADKFIELVHRYNDFSELTTPMIYEFIDKIVVHEVDKSIGERI